MNNIKLSIVLPCYNVEKYVAECLDSLYAQDIPEAEYEVICVNDCSPDGTRDIVVEYQQKHSNLILIDHEINKKQGGARNTGLRAAQGEYVWFVDPDDYIRKNVLRSIIDEIENNSLDILIFDYEKFDALGSVIEIPKVDYIAEISSGKEVLKNTNYYDITSLCWLRVVRRDFLIRNELFFYPNYYFEDVINGVRCFLKAEKIKYYPLLCYFYRSTPNSVMNSKIDALKTISYLKLGFEYYKLSTEISDDKNLSIRFYEIAKFFFKSVEKPILYLNFKERKAFYRYIRKYTEIDKIKDISTGVLFNLLVFSRLSAFLLYFISPLLHVLKKLKNL